MKIVTNGHNGQVVESQAPSTPSTPINLQSPPTPDFTPPKPRRVNAVQQRPRLAERYPGSRNDSINTTDSFKTAKESIESSEDDSTLRAVSTPQRPQTQGEDEERTPRQVPPKMMSLGLGLHGLDDAFTRHKTPTSAVTPLPKKSSFEHDDTVEHEHNHFNQFDGDWSPRRGERRVQSEAIGMDEPRAWDSNLMKNVTVKRGKKSYGSARKPKPYNFDDQESPSRRQQARRSEVVEDDLRSPSNATRHLKEYGVDDGLPTPVVNPTPKAPPGNTMEQLDTSPLRQQRQPIPHDQETPDVRRFSSASHRSSIVSAVIIPQQQPLPPRRTLRHTKKTYALRDFSPQVPVHRDFSPRVPIHRDFSHRVPVHREFDPNAVPTETAINGVHAENRREAVKPRHLSEQVPKTRAVEEVERPRNASMQSSATTSTESTVKSKSRKRLIAEGIVPVVIIPQRTTSMGSEVKRPPPSLRSTSTDRRSRPTSVKSSSLRSAPLSASAGTNIPGAFPESGPPSLRPSLKEGMRGSDGGCSLASSIIRAMDTPPAIPPRRSSMSAPTTPLQSRSNSLTADSLRAHNAAIAVAAATAAEEASGNTEARNVDRDSGIGYGVPIPPPRDPAHTHDSSKLSPKSANSGTRLHRATRSSVDTNGDPFFGYRLSAQHTPFSSSSHASHETGVTHGTALEVAEAREVGMVMHRNKSVQLVDQEPPSSSASESMRKRPSTGTTRPRLPSLQRFSSMSSGKGALDGRLEMPQMKMKVEPATPRQMQTRFPANDGDCESPLINPRDPPQPPGPPTIKFIPPTPAALAAAEEATKQLGYPTPNTTDSSTSAFPFPTDANGEVSRPPRRNWSLRGLRNNLHRSFSLKRRNTTGAADGVMDVDVGAGVTTPADFDDGPSDASMLHPDWRPASSRRDDYFGDDLEFDPECDCAECVEHFSQLENYQPVATKTRPRMRTRTLSPLSQMSERAKKFKKNFRVLPIARASSSVGDEGAHVSYATARRTIRRSGSGNLKVVERVGNVSKESLKLADYVNFAAKRQRSLRRKRSKDKLRRGNTTGIGSESAKGNGNGNGEVKGTPPKKRFSWVGGSTDSPAAQWGGFGGNTYDSPRDEKSDTIRRVFFPPQDGAAKKVQFQWLGLGGLGRRFSEERKEEKREGLRRTISAPRGVRDGVEEVLEGRIKGVKGGRPNGIRREDSNTRRVREGREAGVQAEDFARY